MGFELTYQPYSERSILIEWPQKIDQNILFDILDFKKTLQNSNIKQILQINNTYSSILVYYKYTIDNIYNEISTLKSQYDSKISSKSNGIKRWKIPVCYDDQFASDLEQILIEKQCSKSQIIKWHTKPIYTVFFIGFLPGFLYLGGLDKRLYFQRKNKPRMKVEKGAVGIGDFQTGIYPNSSPAGWNIIGNSPLEFFNMNVNPPCFATAGDQVKFYPVDLDQYYDIKKRVISGEFKLEMEIIHG
ncbi:5-oxoprolinase subunit PxpB [Psychroserpens sp. XS_ASV72]|uniref:5-oxoprolinase subunit PxpB n=1 Tax=Psychroserpens sp. XS_ASV72 TaxID=3241293 RepID=UPI0035148801